MAEHVALAPRSHQAPTRNTSHPTKSSLALPTSAPVQRLTDMQAAINKPKHGAPTNTNVIQCNGVLSKILTNLRRMQPAVSSKIAPKTKLYRSDRRGPDVIARNGFLPKIIRLPQNEITQGDIASYQLDNTQNPGIVSTADTEHSATSFAE